MFVCVLNMFSMYGRSQTSQDSMHLLNVFSVCCGCVLNMFWKCFQCVWWGSKLNRTFVLQKKWCRKKENWLEAMFFVSFSLKQKQHQQIRQTYWTHSLQWSGRKVESTTKNQKQCLYKIQPNSDFCWCLDPKQRFLHKIQLFWDDFWGCIWTKFLVPIYIYIAGGFPWFGFCRSAGCPRSQQKWGWVFGFVRLESFLFKCYGLGFVEAVLVFSRNVSTKSEAPTPPGQFFGVGMYI
jgi:hypothetical protein